MRASASERVRASASERVRESKGAPVVCVPACWACTVCMCFGCQRSRGAAAVARHPTETETAVPVAPSGSTRTSNDRATTAKPRWNDDDHSGGYRNRRGERQPRATAKGASAKSSQQTNIEYTYSLEKMTTWPAFDSADADASCYERYALRAVQFHPDGGQFDFVWLPTRTTHPHGAYVW